MKTSFPASLKLELTLFILLSYILSGSLYAQKPNWIDFTQRQTLYPASWYVVGFSMEINKNKESVSELHNRLIGFAKTQLLESIKVRIESMTTLNVTEIDNDIHSYFKKVSVSYSNMAVAGMKTETYYDKGKKRAYAIAYSRKEDILNQYKLIITQKKAILSQKTKLAEDQRKKGQK